jgi:hypothetical protein
MARTAKHEPDLAARTAANHPELFAKPEPIDFSRLHELDPDDPRLGAPGHPAGDYRRAHVLAAKKRVAEEAAYARGAMPQHLVDEMNRKVRARAQVAAIEAQREAEDAEAAEAEERRLAPIRARAAEELELEQMKSELRRSQSAALQRVADVGI